jgi:hypothetical protein
VNPWDSPENVLVLLKKKASPMSMVGFPLLLIPLTIYNIIVFLMPGVSLTEPVARLTLMSGAEWPMTLADMLLALGILLLLLEVIKGARPGAKYLTDHLLSLIVFGAAAAEFLLWPRFGTSTYFLLAMLALVDFLSGIALRARRGMPIASGPGVTRREQRKAAVAAAEPQFDPAPAPSATAAASAAAESVRFDHPEEKVVHAEVTPAVSSPEVSSPELQPGESVPPSPDPRPR